MKKLVNRYCALGLVLAGSAASAEGVKVGGFVAPGFTFTKAAAGGNTSTFSLADGALYINHSNDTANVVIDIPFSGGTTNNSFNIATTKAQAYFSHKWENGLSWKLGQFDSMYGYEGNDLSEIPFASHGLLYSTPNFLPYTHTGLELGYDFSDMLGLNLLVANPYDQGARANGQKYDLGAKISTKVDTYHASFGFLYSNPANNAVMGFDVIAGSKLGDLNLDLEAIISKPKTGDTAMGFGGTGVFAVSDTLGLGARVEWLKDTSAAKTLEVTVGPQVSLNKALQVRADYTFSKPSSGTGHAVNVAGVYKF